MPILYANEVPEGRATRKRVDKDGNIVREYTRVWHLRTTWFQEDPLVIQSHGQIPKEGDPHPTDPRAILRELRARQDRGDFQSWFVTATYASDTNSETDSRSCHYVENEIHVLKSHDLNKVLTSKLLQPLTGVKTAFPVP